MKSDSLFRSNTKTGLNVISPMQQDRCNLVDALESAMLRRHPAAGWVLQYAYSTHAHMHVLCDSIEWH